MSIRQASYSKALLVALVFSCALGGGQAATPKTLNSAVQAIEHAPDPSAAVAAYAKAFAVAPDSPKVYKAYVARMVGLGLPAMAYHQAQTLTTLEVNNGLAWGVVAYVDARRGKMSEAISAINLAGLYAPDKTFVQRTAGELVAWYDVKGDTSTISDDARKGLAQVRALLEKRPDFTTAYDTAKRAYQAQASANSQNQPGAITAPDPPQRTLTGH